MRSENTLDNAGAFNLCISFAFKILQKIYIFIGCCVGNVLDFSYNFRRIRRQISQGDDYLRFGRIVNRFFRIMVRTDLCGGRNRDCIIAFCVKVIFRDIKYIMVEFNFGIDFIVVVDSYVIDFDFLEFSNCRESAFRNQCFCSNCF